VFIELQSRRFAREEESCAARNAGLNIADNMNTAATVARISPTKKLCARAKLKITSSCWGGHCGKHARTWAPARGVGGCEVLQKAVSLTIKRSQWYFQTSTNFYERIGTKWKTYAEVRYAKVFADESVSYLPVRVGFIF